MSRGSFRRFKLAFDIPYLKYVVHVHFNLVSFHICKQMLEVFCWGEIKLKTPEEAMDLIENMAASDIAILRDRAHIPTKKILLELTSQDALLAQNKLLSKKLEALISMLESSWFWEKFVRNFCPNHVFKRFQTNKKAILFHNLFKLPTSKIQTCRLT